MTVFAVGGALAGLLLVVFGTPAYAVALALLVTAVVRLAIFVGSAGLSSLAVLAGALFACSPACTLDSGLALLLTVSAAMAVVGLALGLRGRPYPGRPEN